MAECHAFRWLSEQLEMSRPDAPLDGSARTAIHTFVMAVAVQRGELAATQAW